MFTVSNQNNVYGILNNWCICINISCGPWLVLRDQAPRPGTPPLGPRSVTLECVLL